MPKSVPSVGLPALPRNARPLSITAGADAVATGPPPAAGPRLLLTRRVPSMAKISDSALRSILNRR
jgi:hypothetical protein